MNKDRRKSLTRIQGQLNALRTELDALRDEEQDYYDAMPESIQAGAKGDEAQTAIDTMTEAGDGIEAAADQIGELLA